MYRRKIKQFTIERKREEEEEEENKREREIRLRDGSIIRKDVAAEGRYRER